jgi:lactoylglutathione lyase
MDYAYTSLVVEDVKSAAAFYQQAFGFRLDHAHDEWDYAEIETGRTRISLVAPSLVETHLPIAVRVNRADEMPAGIELTFVVEDVDAAFDRAVEAGAAVLVRPSEKLWGQAAYVRDPHGVLIQLATR